jgi:hypothetical protein
MLMISRLKFPIQPLVTEMLDQLPADVWTSSTTRFLDPAMGGGQFLVEIQTRLRAAGHSDENIAERMYGCEINKLRVNYTKNNKKLVTNNLFISDFLSHNWGNMKFDVIVGNPPYQSEKRTGTQPLWPLFAKKSFELLTDTGYMGMITPNKWCGHTANVIKGAVHLYGDIFRNKMMVCNIQECSKYFPGVGSYANSFSWFLMNNAGCNDFKATTLDGVFEVKGDWFQNLPLRSLNQTTANIVGKVAKSKSFDFKQVSTGFENQNNGAVVISMAQRMHYSKLNVYWDKNSLVKPTSKSTISQAVFDKSSQKKVDAVFKSKLYKFLYSIYWNNDNFSTGFYNSLPYVDLNKLWTDNDLFKFFKLTQDEISYIEAYLATHE